VSSVDPPPDSEHPFLKTAPVYRPRLRGRCKDRAVLIWSARAKWRRDVTVAERVRAQTERQRQPGPGAVQEAAPWHGPPQRELGQSRASSDVRSACAGTGNARRI
jgi:hypothetical protein